MKSPHSLLAIALLAGGVLGCPAPEASHPPDVFLITLDTTRADHLSVYGYERETSPFLERFAADAVTYERAWATGAWTLPTHASIMTGRYVSNHGAHFDLAGADASLSEVLEGDFFAEHKANRLPEEEVTLAELLGAKGYATGAFSAGPWLAEPFGLMQGYDLRDVEITSSQWRSAEELTDRMIDWLSATPRDQPVHGLINYFDPHSPWEPPPGFDDLPGVKIPLEEDQDPMFINGGGRRLKASQRVAMIDRYDGEIRYMDHHLGRLLRALEEAGRYTNALIIIVGDHGELFGEHGVVGHGRWLYEPVARVPLLIHFPGGRDGGTRVASLVSQVDLLPLVAELLSLPLPENVDGRPIGSRRQLIAEAYRDPFSVGHYGHLYDRDLAALIRWPWKLIRSDTGEREVFDLGVDPLERQSRGKADIDGDLEAALADELAALAPRAEGTPATDVSAETEESLRGLGYIE